MQTQEAVSFDFPANVNIADDLDLGHDPETHQDPSLPLPLMAGRYGVRFTKAGLKRKRDDSGNPTEELQLVDGKYPIFTISSFQTVQPEDVKKTAYPFQEIVLKPTTKMDFNAGGQRMPYNPLAAIIRSHDATIPFKGLEEGLQILKGLLSDGAIFYVQTDWVAEDRDWLREQRDALKAAVEAGEVTEEERKARNSVIYKAGKVDRFSKFIQTVNGQKVAVPEFVGPSGETIEARPYISEWISTAQLSKFKLGPRKI
jgi:hypothetical protein